jgi:hypothetical protein
LQKGGDYYLLANDFPGYLEAQERVDAAYRDPALWTRMSILSTAGSGAGVGEGLEREEGGKGMKHAAAAASAHNLDTTPHHHHHHQPPPPPNHPQPPKPQTNRQVLDRPHDPGVRRRHLGRRGVRGARPDVVRLGLVA